MFAVSAYDKELVMKLGSEEKNESPCSLLPENNRNVENRMESIKDTLALLLISIFHHFFFPIYLVWEFFFLIAQPLLIRPTSFIPLGMEEEKPTTFILGF